VQKRRTLLQSLLNVFKTIDAEEQIPDESNGTIGQHILEIAKHHSLMPRGVVGLRK
jgi:hypothetical protein